MSEESNNLGLTEEMVEEEIPKQMGLFDRLISIFIAPGKLMENLHYHQPIWSIIIVVIVFALFLLPLTPRLVQITTAEMSAISIERYGMDMFNPVLPDDVKDQVENVKNIGATVGSVIGTLSIPLFVLVSALILFIVSKIAKGTATIKQYFSMYLHIRVISAIGSLITTSLMIMMNTSLDMTSLAAVLMPNGNMTNLLYCILISINVFGIWSNILVFIGVKKLNDFTNTRAAVVTIVMFLLTLAFTVGSLASTFMMLDWQQNMLQNIQM